MKTATYPLSASQTGIYYEWEKDKSLTQYNMSFVYEFPATFDAPRLREAFEKVIAAHPTLKARLVREGEEVGQVYDEDDPVVISLQTVRETEMKAVVDRFVRPFDLMGPALYRLELYQTEKKLYALVDIHHIIFDGGSNGVFNRDLARAYAGEALTKETFTVCDYARQESCRQGDAEYCEAESYFEKKLEGVVMTRVPTLHNKEPEPGMMRCASEFLPLAEVNESCRKLGVSPNNLFAGAVGLVLSAYTREERVAFCTLHHGRQDERLYDDTGMFVKTLPVVLTVLPTQPVSAYLSSIGTDLKELWTKQAYPFPEIVKKTGVVKEVLYTFQKGFVEYFDMAGGRIACRYLHAGKTTDSLTIYVYLTPETYEIRCEYNDSLYEAVYMETFAAALKNAVLNMMADAGRPCGAVPLLSPAQEGEVLALSSGEAIDHDRSQSIVDLVCEQIRKTPNNTAVVFGDQKITYRELDQLTDRLAKKLVSLGVGREKIVGVMIDRSEYMVIYPLAILKAGGAYMPLDFTLPPDRLAFMVKDAGVGHILSEGTRVAETLPDFKGVVITKEKISTLKIDEKIALPRPVPEDSYVVLYTSGSTGTPKGCILEHRNIVNFTRWYVKDFNLTPDDRAAAYANFSFDCHMLDIFPPLSVGASLYVIPSSMKLDLFRMNQYLEENKLTIAFMTTQVGRQFAEDIDNHSLRLLSVAGERLIPVKKPRYRFYNAYGPTECTIFATFYDIQSDYNSSLIGRSLGNYKNLIMDHCQRLLPPGVAGELCIGGAGVGRGYLNRPELTAEKFIPWRGERLYRSGDLARYTPEGEIEYFRRLDNQIKLRGLRIELGEIENAMSKYEGVSAAVVDVREIGGVQHLCGYFTAKTKVDVEAMRVSLRVSLAEFMVPTALIQIEAFPLTSNGKVNRKLLPEPKIEAEEITAPQTEMERQLSEVIADLIKTRDFGIDTNLFSLGLTSILAIKLSVAIQKKLAIAIETKDILKFKTIRHIAVVAETAKRVEAVKAAAYDRRDFYPLSENQKGVYYDWEKNREAIQYNMPVALRFSAAVDVERLKAAVVAVIENHPYLKTTLAIRGDEVVQLRRDHLPAEIIVTRTAEDKIEPILSSFIRPFNLFGDTLYRFSIVQTEHHTDLLFDIHHLIYDGSSMGVLLAELKEAFEGKRLAPELFTAFDHALEEQEAIKSATFTEAEAYFEKLIGKTAMTAFPAYFQPVSAGTAREFSVFIPAGGIVDFCRQHAVTENNFFLAVLALVLGRYTRQNPVALTTATSGRADRKLANLIGMFVKTLPVVVDLKPVRGHELVKEIQDQMFATMEHDIYSFTKMAEKFGVTPQVNYVYQGGIDKDLCLGDERAQVNILGLNTVKFPFSVVIYPEESGYALSLEFDDAQYPEPDVRVFAETFATAVRILAESADVAIDRLSLVPPAAEAAVIAVASGRRLEHDRSLSLVDLFRAQARKTPDQVAVVYDDRRLTYGELDTITDRLARRLRAIGVEKEKPVGVMIDRSEYLVIYPLAVLKAGGGYMPLDYSMPPDRLAFMVKDAGVEHLLSEGNRVAEALPGFAGQVLNKEDLAALSVDEAVALPVPDPTDLFVLLYTSGSTGTPKGCILEHRNIVNFCRWCVEEYGITPADRSAAYANFAFDAHMIDIYPMITSGASVYIIPSAMRMDLVRMNQYMNDNGLTVAFMTTQIGRQFAEDLPNRSLRVLAVGGERLIPTKKPPYRFYNGYGPTECTIFSVVYRIEADYDTAIIGRSLANVQNFIMDQHLHLLPPGVAGEICIGGEGVGRGYLNRPDLNREKFVAWRGQRLYRSGDLARYNAQGEIEYLSRLDNQVKLRGLRIELEEVEKVMAEYEGVSAAVVDVKEIAGVQHLCGYFTAKRPVDLDAMRKFLRKSLTEYMVPSSLRQLDKFPFTNNGKVNRKALPAPEAPRTVEYAPPTNAVEEGICRVFSEILRIERIGIDDNFFEIGGSSMSAIKAIIKIINLGHKIKYGDLFKLKTPKAIAEFLAGPAETKEREEAPPEDIPAYDYTAINQVLEAGRRDLWQDYVEYSLGDVLLTGATGYLGIHVLRELLDAEDGKIYCLVRSKGALTPEARLKSLLMYYFSEPFEELFSKRIVAVNGDVTAKDTLDTLKGKGIRTVFNCAASVKHYAAGNELDKINTESVGNLVAFCQEEGARLIQISTMSSSGMIEKEKFTPGVALDEFKLYFGQTIVNKYVLTKFRSERLVLQAVSAGLDGKVVRVGNLMGRHADGEFQINFRSNAFVNKIKCYKVMKMFPLSQLASPIEISPVDSTARAVVALAKIPREIAVLHAYNNYILDMANVVYAMKDYGFDIAIVSDPVFNDQFQAMLQDPRKSEHLSGLLHYKVGDDFVDVPWENTFTTTLLYRNDVRWPLPGGHYSHRLIEKLDGMGFFDEN